MGQNVFSNRIISGISARLPELDPSVILQAGATELQRAVKQSGLSEADRAVAVVLEIYNDAIVQAFTLALILACISILGAVEVEWRTVKSSSQGDSNEQNDGGE